MVKLTEDFSAKKYSAGWELHQYIKTESSNAKKEYRTNITFHPTLLTVCRFVIDNSLGECADAKEVIEHMSRLTKELKAVILEAGT